MDICISSDSKEFSFPKLHFSLKLIGFGYCIFHRIKVLIVIKIVIKCFNLFFYSYEHSFWSTLMYLK